jgi:type IV secretory pathway VirJ component
LKHVRVISGLVVLAALAVGVYEIRARKGGALGPPPAAVQVWTPVTEQQLSHGRFEHIHVYVPHATARGFVLLLSGDAGWNDGLRAQARRLAAQGALVAGLDTGAFNRSLQTDGAQCVFPDGDLENLSHFVQAYFRLPAYLSPILVGDSSGATLAYATLVQAPAGTFAGAVSMNFCPTYGLEKPLCKGSGIEFTTQGSGISFLPTRQSGLSWTVIPHGDQACNVEAVRSFVAQVPGARFASPAGVDVVAATVDSLMAQHPGAVPAMVPAVLSDLPIITVPAQVAAGSPSGAASANTMAIILSGDGGWAGLDKEVAGALAASGIPVIGLDSLRYFWSARTPAGLAADLDRMTHYYVTALDKPRVLLIGYSQGADVLPFAVNRLNPETRSHVALTAVLGMSEHALFEFHVTSWISDDDSGPPTLPEVERIGGMPVLCIYGSEEDDTLCPKLDPRKVNIVRLKGGHHFDGDYAGLARVILEAAQAH